MSHHPKPNTLPAAASLPAVRPLAMAIHLLLLGSTFAEVAWLPTAQAQTPAATQSVRRYDIPAGPLSSVLIRFSRESGIYLAGAGEAAAGKTSAGLKGSYAVQEGLAALLAGTGLEAYQQADGSYGMRVAAKAEGAADASVSTLPLVSVTASAEPAASLPPPYAGGQVARGSRLGLLGNKEVMDTPFNTTSYTAELMENQQAITAADVMLNDPSVRTVSYSLTNAAAGGDIFLIRGFSVQDSVLFDGISGIASNRAAPVEMAERIEVLKGPSALLNGMAPGAGGAVGGTINMVPKRADDKPLTRLTATYMSNSNFGGHVDIGRRFGEDNAWGIRFNGVYRDGKNATAGQSVELGAATIGIDYRGNRLRASLDAGHQTMNNEAPQGAAGFGIADGITIPSPPSAKKRIAQDWEYANSKSNYLLAKAEYDLTPAWTLYGAAGGSNTTSSYLSTDVSVADTQGNAQATIYYWPNWTNYRTAQGGVRGNFSTGAIQHQLNINANYVMKDSGYTADYYGFSSFATNIYNQTSISRPSTASMDSHPAKTNRLQLPSLAVADTMAFLDDRLAITLGGRYQRVQVIDYDTTTGESNTAYDEHALTPVLAAVIKPGANWSIYSNYIEGLTQGDTAPIGTTNAGKVFPPVKTKQHEVGVKYDFGRFTTSLSTFQIEKPSGLTVSNGDGTSTYQVGGEQRNRGIELNVFGEVQGVRLLGGATYIQPKLTHASSDAYDGNTAPNVSRWQLNLGSEYDLSLLPGMTLTARMMSTSAQYLDEANTRSIPGWTRWDIGARYKTEATGRPLVIRAGINNLFGRDYWASSTGNWLYLGQPRTVMISATMDF
ncbi:TonB-dependent receptor [Methylovorus mays]|uniref:TonB-dependent receptor n=1 Tax=Methylovorus mays TaxID=184077 RepID=UPI001E5ED528|nr:TonB-dependent receptor [Methylovorus mays]MCB5207454.1 TonB-dependent receptor [Methylovorus mays]